MLSDPDPNKHAAEALFSRKINSDGHPKLKFSFKDTLKVFDNFKNKEKSV